MASIYEKNRGKKSCDTAPLIHFSWIRFRIIFAWIRIRIKGRPGFGSVTKFFTSWIRIRIKMIRIRNTANDGFGSGLNESADKFEQCCRSGSISF